MFKIGDFSRFTRVSVKMLRHYDEIGLLRPAYIDPDNNYRYYSSDQLPRLNRIIALKDLGFSLEQIAEILYKDLPVEQIQGMFRLREAEIQQRIEEEHKRLRELRIRLKLIETREDEAAYDVVLREIPAQWIAGIRTRIGEQDNVAPLFDEVEAFAAREQARAFASPLMIFHDEEYEGEMTDIEVAAPLLQEIPSNERVTVRQLPAEATMACVVYTGGYERVPEVLRALMLWIEGNRYQVSGPMREVYLRFNADSEQDFDLPGAFLTDRRELFVTEIQLPVRPEGSGAPVDE